MVWIPAFLKSQLCFRKGASYHPNRYPLMARVKPCTDQHLGVTKITSDRQIWLHYCSFHQVIAFSIGEIWLYYCSLHPQTLNNNVPQFPSFVTQFIQWSCHVLTEGVVRVWYLKTMGVLVPAAQPWERRGRQNQFGTQPCSSGASAALWIS